MSNPQGKASKLAAEFAAAVRRTRERQQLSQAQLADASGLTPAAISQIESGLREPTFSSIIKIATALKTSPNDLMGLEESHPDPAQQALYRDLKSLSASDYEKVSAFARFLASEDK